MIDVSAELTYAPSLPTVATPRGGIYYRKSVHPVLKIKLLQSVQSIAPCETGVRILVQTTVDEL